ncbi:MAG: TonB-dependent receptor, partial [Clostridiales bacterium]|nr:TonB-dependent receptor [Clostridiales bacterium]
MDGSLTLGGPIMVDKIWFFTNGRYIKQERVTNFIGPFTDVLGYTHNPYNWTHQEQMGFFKLTSQLGSKIKLMGMLNYTGIYRPMYEEPGSRTNFISTRIWDHERGYTGNAVLNYILDQNTFVDLRFGYVHRWFPLPLQPEAVNLPYIYNYGDLYSGLTTARFNETYLRKRWQTGLYLTRFQDNFLGGNHEFKAGVEFEDSYGDWDWWRKDNLLWYADTRYAYPYYYFGSIGYVAFYICSTEEGSSKIIDKARRIGAYIQDSATFMDRLTLNIGVRFDRSWGFKPAVTKGKSADLSYWIGENVVRPYVKARFPDRFPNGLNPFGEISAPEWNDIIVWNEFSPRLGITYDLFGNGKTALKLSFNRYTEYLMLQYFSVLGAFYPRSFAFYWTDTNGDGTPNMGDTFTIYGSPDYRVMDPAFSEEKLDPKCNSPLADELTVGIWHELFKNFSLGLNFIYKQKTNILEDVLYDPDTKKYWYHIDQAEAAKNWIPFTTTIPGTDNYPDRTVTFYARKNDSPAVFYQFTNVPELERKYWAVELIFNKRMADGWQFGGSIVYSKAYGNIGGWYDQSWGWSGAGDNPNYFVNQYGRLNTDRPLQIKLYGTAQLPLRFFLSAFYQYQDGDPWARSGSIRPPTSWATATNTFRTYYGVNIETPGERRGRAWNTLDVRLEKEFTFGDFGRLGAYIDVENLLGWSGVGVGLNDLYRWDPVAEGANQPGTKQLSTSYKVISSVSGTREVKFSLRFSF